MTADLPDSALELRSLVTSQGTLELSLHDVPVPTPAANEVLVRVEASPVNPSDLGLLIAGADMATATVAGTPERPIVTASLGAGALGGLSARVDKPLPVGNEGAGRVVAAGSSPAAQSLLGRTVGIAGGPMYTQYRVVDASACLVLPEGTTARDGASSFVNPLTALGMVETMRREGHSGLVHTAAASNLGQMLVKLCQKDGVPLVNIVRKRDQEELLRALGAVHVCNSGSPSFSTDLVEAYDPATNMWTLVGRDVVPRGDDSGGVHDGRIYVAGGEGQDFARKYVFWLTEAFNPATGAFMQLPHMQVARHGFAVAIVGNQLHVMGGGFQSDGMPRVDTATATHEVLDLGQ